MTEEKIEIEKLFDDLVARGAKVVNSRGYEMVECNDVEVQTLGDKFVKINCVSRHKTPKNMMRITVKSEAGFNHVEVTTDHVCMTYDRDKILQNVNAKNLNLGDYVQVEKNGKEFLGEIVSLMDCGKTDEWVYDLEVDDDAHAFYADSILVHNSQFVNLQCVSDWMRDKYGLPHYLSDWDQEHKQMLWDLMAKMTDEDINPFVRGLVHDYCHTSQQNVLTYELEYMGDNGIYECKKHYAVHKIFEEGEAVNFTKFSGIELKKAQVPKEMKTYLAEIYDGALLKHWTENDYAEYVNKVYDTFKNLDIDTIALWKGYNTDKKDIMGFLQYETGTTGIAKAAKNYNQIVQKLGLGKKYDEVRVGDKVRFCYIDPANEYRINCIAYKPGQWPEEFKDLFKIDYPVMFDKLILDPLKRFRVACGFKDTDPTKQVAFDIFSL